MRPIIPNCPSTELPSDVQEKLRELKDKLQEFLKQQKKVIEATESLAKAPVEDFSDKDEKKLKEILTPEQWDKWQKFREQQKSKNGERKGKKSA